VVVIGCRCHERVTTPGNLPGLMRTHVDVFLHLTANYRTRVDPLGLC
jgi:hypothetical protein